MSSFAKVADVEALWRPLTEEEQKRAIELIPIVENSLRAEADKVSKDLDLMVIEKPYLSDVAKSVVVDVIARTLMTSTNQEPMIQSSESALGYSMSGTFLVPGGGLFIKRSELDRLGLRRQKVGAIDLCSKEPK